MEYNILENAIFVPISAKIGTNLEILKEKILDIVHEQKEFENLRYVEEDEWLELEEEEKLNEALKGQREEQAEREKVVEVDLSDDIYSLRNSSSSAGVLLDIVKSRKLGTTLHVVIRRGEVRLNQHEHLYFCYHFCKTFLHFTRIRRFLGRIILNFNFFRAHYSYFFISFTIVFLFLFDSLHN